MMKIKLYLQLNFYRFFNIITKYRTLRIALCEIICKFAVRSKERQKFYLIIYLVIQVFV